MPNLNKVMLIGHLTRDPQLKYLPSQMAVAEFGLAINSKYRTAAGEDREDVCFVDCAAFGKRGEAINQYLTKGMPLYVEGRLKYDTWEDRQGGGKRSKLSIIVDSFQFLGGGSGGREREQDAGGGDYDEQPRQQTAPQGRRGALPQRSAAASQGRSTGPAMSRPTNPPAQQPFGDEQHFQDADIPF